MPGHYFISPYEGRGQIPSKSRGNLYVRQRRIFGPGKPSRALAHDGKVRRRVRGAAPISMRKSAPRRRRA